MIGIYKITNTINNKVYIGQSIDIGRRWVQHKNSSLDYPLYNDFRSFGLNNFKFEIICECKRLELDELELKYINQYNSFNSKYGYNQTIGNGIYGHGVVFTYDTIFNLIDDLQDSTLTKRQLAMKYNCNERTIRDVNNGITWYQDNINYPIRSYFVSELDGKKYYNRKLNFNSTYTICPKCGSKMCVGAKLCRKCTNATSKLTNISKEELLDLLANNKITEVARKLNVSHTTIRRWCKKYNIVY